MIHVKVYTQNEQLKYDEKSIEKKSIYQNNYVTNVTIETNNNISFFRNCEP